MTDDGYRLDPDGELLSAWLAGDLDRPGAEEIERRLANEPALAARLDRVHDTLVALRDLGAVEPPPGMSERLRERLAAEHVRPVVTSLDDHRTARNRRWPALSAAAAVLVLLAVIPILSRTLPGGGSGGNTAAEDAELTIEQAEPEAAAPAASDQAADAARSGPVIAEGGEAAQQAPDGRERSAALQELYAGAPEAAQLLGTPVTDAETIASDYADQIRAAAPFATVDADPSACLDEMIADAPVVVPVRVEGFLADGAVTLTYVLVTASPGSDVLDVVEVRMVDAATCAAA